METLMRRRSFRIWAASTAALLVAVSACADPTGEDKAGTETIVLEFATINGEANMGDGFVDIDAFADHIEEVSDGLIQVEIAVSFGEGAADAEASLVEAIASGTVDGGNPAVRAFARAGISGLEPLEAPMTLTNYDVLQELVASPLADSFLERLNGSGLVGLGLVVGELRRPFGVEAPILGPDDWDGLRFRTFSSDLQGESVRALGGEPVDSYSETWGQIAAGTLDGIEVGVGVYQATGRATEAPHVASNVVLWPKVPVLTLSQTRWDTLSAEQREWISEAAAMTVRQSVAAAYDETTAAAQLCEAGVRFYDATSEQLDRLTESLAPVYAQFEADALWMDLVALAEAHPEVDVPEVSSECAGSPGIAEEDPVIPEEVSAIPEGIYRVSITPADVETAGFDNDSGWSGTWTLEIADGIYTMKCRPFELPDRDCGNAFVPGSDLPFDAIFEAGYVRGTGNTVFFVYDAQVHSDHSGCELPCFPIPTYEVGWELEGDMMTFSDVRGSAAAEKVIKPWEKIG
jgi:TRAP-type C4-dicarboxylate transport system substrate-binding protein